MRALYIGTAVAITLAMPASVVAQTQTGPTLTATPAAPTPPGDVARPTALADPLPSGADAPAQAIPATPAPAAPAAPAATPPVVVSTEFSDKLAEWATLLETRAQALEAVPAANVTRIGDGDLLKKWSTGDRVERLSQRLVELGFLSAKKKSVEYDEAIENAVRRFQAEQGMKVDGMVGATTRALLDRSTAQKADVLKSTAKAIRELRDESLPDVVLVNLPSQTVRVVRAGKVAFTMRAVVGRPSRETPLLRDEITDVIVNPTWTVPPTVLREDKMPKLRSSGSPGINNAIVYLDGSPVAPETVDWKQVTPGRVRIVQQPGDGNALGRFRFNLTNPDNIYLHGTNEPRLFDRELRTISSGCVRLQDARRLAEELLIPEGVSKDTIDRMLQRGKPQWVKLSAPLPVRFTYWMATVDDNGHIRTHPDIYGMEEKSQTAPPKPEPASPSPA